MDVRNTVLSERLAEQLRSSLGGVLITAGHPDYDSARSVAAAVDRRPAAIVRAADGTDVAAVVALARDNDLELAIRGGGHSGAGHGTCDGGIVLDLGAMKALDVDVKGRTAWAEAGFTAGELTSSLAEHGLAVGFGDTATVGIGGITLGGGVGYLSRKFGLTIDSLIGADVITADGRLVHADADSHPDLFWGIRGGGGNFGVVTRFGYSLQPLDSIVGGLLVLPATPEVIAGFIAAAESAPDDLSAIVNVMAAPPLPFLPPEIHGQLVVFAMIAYVGPLSESAGAIAPFRTLAKPIVDMIRPMKYPEIYPPDDGSSRPTAITRGLLMDHVGGSEAAAILDHLRASDAPLRVVQLRVLGGAVARVPVDATAFAHRKSRIIANVTSSFAGADELPVRLAWAERLAAALRQNDHGVYVNFLAEEGPDRIHAAYPGATWDRLAAIKAHYDPGNLFHLNQNIPPARGRQGS